MSYPPSMLGWGKRKRHLPPLLCWESVCGPPAWPLSSTGRCWAGLCWGAHFGKAQLPPCCHPAHPQLWPHISLSPDILSLGAISPSCCCWEICSSCFAPWPALNSGFLTGPDFSPSCALLPACSTYQDQFVISQKHGLDPGSQEESPPAAPLWPNLLGYPPKGSFLCCKMVVACTLWSFHPF